MTFLFPHAENPDFRQVLLYFIRQAFLGLENGLYAYYNVQNSKRKKKRRGEAKVAMRECVKRKFLREDQLDSPSYSFNNRAGDLYDFSSKLSARMVQNLEVEAKDNLKRFFAEEMRYADLKSCDDLLAWMNGLRDVRDFLEHYDERKEEKSDKKNKKKKEEEKNLTEEDFFRFLGRLLLPPLSGLLEGQLRSKRWHKGYVKDRREEKDWASKAKGWEKNVKCGREVRKAARKQYKDAVLVICKTDKARRQRLAKENETFRLNYMKWFPDKYRRVQAYRLENLRDYHFALGSDFLAKLKSEGGCGSFFEVEELHAWNHRLGLCFALILGYLERKWLQDLGKTKSDFEKYTLKKLVIKTDFSKKHKDAGKSIYELRNHIAHGRLPFMKEDAEGGGERYFHSVLLALRHEGEKEQYNRLYDDVFQILRRGRRIEVWSRDREKEEGVMTQKMRVYHWRDGDRERLATVRKVAVKEEGEVRVKLERYRYLRSQAGDWMEKLQEADGRVRKDFPFSTKKSGRKRKKRLGRSERRESKGVEV